MHIVIPRVAPFASSFSFIFEEGNLLDLLCEILRYIFMNGSYVTFKTDFWKTMCVIDIYIYRFVS